MPIPDSAIIHSIMLDARILGFVMVSLLTNGSVRAHDTTGVEPLFVMDAYVVIGTRTERLITEAPVKTELIRSSDLSHYNATSFRDALKLIPTARFENDCQNCGVNQIQLLGLSTDYTSILFDGAPLYSGLAKVYGADIFPAIFIDRIEVVKGGSSVLYGPEAMAGVINLITEAPQQSGVTTNIGYEILPENAREWEASFRANHVNASRSLSLSLYGLNVDREGVDLSGDAYTEIPEFNNRVLGMQVWWKPNPTSTLKANYQFMDQSHRGGDSLDLPEEQARVAESLTHEMHLAQLSWKQSISDAFDYGLSFSSLLLERTSFYGARGDNEQRAWESSGFTGTVTDAFIQSNSALIDAIARRVWGTTDNAVIYVDSQFNHRWIQHTISYGIQYRYEDLRDGSLHDPDAPSTQDDFGNVGLFLQDQWTVNSRLELVPGLRFDKHDNVDATIFSPRLAARYFINDCLTSRVSWSTGFNAPGAFNEDKHIGVNNGGAIFLVNEAGLEEESSQTFSAGAEYQPLALDRRLTLHSQVHYTFLEDTFEIDDTGELSGDPNLWLRYNGPDASVFVWENNLNWQSGPFRIDAGLSWIRARLDEAVERVSGLVTDAFIKRPEWTGHLGLSYENPDTFNIHSLLSYTGSMIAIGQDADIWRHTPRFLVWDLGLSKTFGNVFGNGALTLSVGVENLLDERQKDLQNNGEERDPTYQYGPVQPRTWYARVNMDW